MQQDHDIQYMEFFFLKNNTIQFCSLSNFLHFSTSQFSWTLESTFCWHSRNCFGLLIRVGEPLQRAREWNRRHCVCWHMQHYYWFKMISKSAHIQRRFLGRFPVTPFQDIGSLHCMVPVTWLKAWYSLLSEHWGTVICYFWVDVEVTLGELQQLSSCYRRTSNRRGFTSGMERWRGKGLNGVWERQEPLAGLRALNEAGLVWKVNAFRPCDQWLVWEMRPVVWCSWWNEVR